MILFFVLFLLLTHFLMFIGEEGDAYLNILIEKLTYSLHLIARKYFGEGLSKSFFGLSVAQQMPR